jgi:hypothetical protein
MSALYFDFKSWWNETGSALRNNSNEDFEEFAFRISQVAWLAAALKEREACAKVCDSYSNGRHSNASDLCAEQIRARGEVK